MSFDVYLVSLEHQQPSGVPRSAIVAAFGDDVRWDDEHSGWTQYTPIDRCQISLDPLESDPDLICCISINRPVADARFLDSLYAIMRLGCVALFWPSASNKGPLIASPSDSKHLPEFEHYTHPIVVGSGAELLEQIESS